MMKESILEKIIVGTVYRNNSKWDINNIKNFSHNKKLYYYQISAIEAVLKSLYCFYNENNGDKEIMYNKYRVFGLENGSFSVPKYNNNRDKAKFKTNKQYELFKEFYDEKNDNIEGYNFINRNSFWMATASGKSILIIKLIEVLNTLIENGAIPNNEILLLLPSYDLIEQIKKEFDDYNLYKSSKNINMINLKDYSKSKRFQTIFDDINVYYYRSDLLRDKSSDQYIDFREYENNGKWYIILDEVHRGSKNDSLMQNYVSILSRNGFLFNFSATFTENIDFITNVYNFNLEKFILAGYGKNIYLLDDTFTFNKQEDELSEYDKKKQLLKSIVLFTIIKKSIKNKDMYHYPLMMTLVNSVNTKDSDLLLFFKKLEEIASGEIDDSMLNDVKSELFIEFSKHNKYVFGKEKINLNTNILNLINPEVIRENIFHSKTIGCIEILTGKNGKELCLKLETSDKPFALIKIGDTDTFASENLRGNYRIISNYGEINYFNDLNSNQNINILIGSRSFYEGWDSNRPNIINLINIGGQDAMKFVPQAIGRGVRIEPKQGYRMRLSKDDINRNELLETLFLFPTDKQAINCIMDTIKSEESSNREGFKITVERDKNLTNVELLYPKFGVSKEKTIFDKISLSTLDIERFKDYISKIDKELILIKHSLNISQVNKMYNLIEENNLFEISERNHISNMSSLVKLVVDHIRFNVKDFQEPAKIGNQIIHFENIVAVNVPENKIRVINEAINAVNSYDENIDKKELAQAFANNEITQDEFLRLLNSKPEVYLDDLYIKKLTNHYYNPLLMSSSNNYRNIVQEESEIVFIKNLCNFLNYNKPILAKHWYFSKLVENVDNIYIPYYDKVNNKYRKFYPDFVFWIISDNKYKVIFVDPKGTKIADYQNKVDSFKSFFYDNDNPKEFKYKDYNVTFELILVSDNINNVAKEYKYFWKDNCDFTWLK